MRIKILLYLSVLFILQPCFSLEIIHIYPQDTDWADKLGMIRNDSYIVFHEGVYSNTFSLIDARNVTLEGKGCVIIQSDDVYDTVFNLIDSANIYIRNISFVQAKELVLSQDFGHMISVRNSSNVIIESCLTRGSGSIGLSAYNSYNLSLLANTNQESSSCGLYFENTTTVTLQNNLIRDNARAIYISQTDSYYGKEVNLPELSIIMIRNHLTNNDSWISEEDWEELSE